MLLDKLRDFIKNNDITKRLFIVYFAVIAVILYFLSCSFFGQNGLVKYFMLSKQLRDQKMIEQENSAKMNEKKKMIQGMDVNSLDLDLVDEQTKRTLGYTKKNEVVVFEKQESE